VNVAELKAKLAALDADIATKRGEVEDATLDLRHLREKRKAFAMRNCKHEDTYERSVMGREIDKYCSICGECLT
jgi:hypothetical protein